MSTAAATDDTGDETRSVAPTTGLPEDPGAIRRAQAAAVLDRYPAALEILQAHFSDGRPSEVGAAFGVYSLRWGAKAFAAARSHPCNILDVHDADDITQDAFIRLWRLRVWPRQFDPSQSETGLLIQMVRNRAIDHHKQRRHDASISLDSKTGEQLISERQADEAIRRAREERFARAALAEAGLTISEKIILERMLQKATAAEIGAEMGLSAGTVANQSSRIRAKLRAAARRVIDKDQS